MALTKVNDCRFASDKEQSKNATEANMLFIIANKKHLLKVRGGEKLLAKIMNFKSAPELTPNMKSEVDRIVELVWKGYDMGKPDEQKLGSFQTTYKPNTKTFLRYGNGRK